MSSTLNASILLKLMDQFSGPAQSVQQKMRGMGAEARKLRRALGQKVRLGFSEANMDQALRRSETRIASARGRLMGAAGMALSLGAPLMQAGNVQEELIHFANLAEIGAERTAQLTGELDALRRQTGKSNMEILGGLDTYVGKGMDLDDALAAMRATGRAATATRSEIGEMAGSGFAVMDNLRIAPEALAQAFDIMAKSGKEGSFELSAMARKFPEITAGAKSLGMEGTESVASLAAALQIAMKSAGSEDQAATNMTNFLGKITAPDTVRKFAKFGVDVEAEMKSALERGVDPLEHMLFKIEEMTGGDAFKMGELFADKQVLDFLRAMIPNMEEYQRIKGEALGASGVIDADYERVMKGFNVQVRELKNSVTSLLGASGTLLPIFTDIVMQLNQGVETIAMWTAEHPQLTEVLIKGGAALLAFGVGTRVLGYGFAVMRGGVLRTLNLFLRFDKAGRNISVVSRSLRGAGRAITALHGLAARPLKWAFAPLRWTARLIPRIPWATLTGGKWAIATLVTPLRWTASLLPNFAPPLARFANFKTAASAEITGLNSHVDRSAQAMRRSLSGVRWRAVGLGASLFALSKGYGELADLAARAPEEWHNRQDQNKQAIEDGLRATPVLNQLLRLGEWQIEQKERSAASIRSNQSVADPMRNLADRQAQFGQMTRPATGANDPALAAFLARSDTSAERIERAVAPLTAAMKAGSAAPATSLRPEARPYAAPQPEVRVESTFESSPNVGVDVQLSMPIHITREMRVDNARVAREAGEKAGAEVERAVRRGLDDAANME